jgi:hypothetical protein
MDTNPQGSAKTVSEAANAFLGMMEPAEAQAQPEVPEEQEAELLNKSTKRRNQRNLRTMLKRLLKKNPPPPTE